MPVDSPNDLYGLPLDRFIPERAALVKAQRNNGQRDEATITAALKKPSAAAWAVNQLVRTQTDSITNLFAAGDALAAAAGGGRDGLDTFRNATRQLREALDALVDAGEGLLDADGQSLSGATLERMTETLRAAALDPDARDQVKDGCLVKELQYAGLGLGGLTATPATKPKEPKEPKQAKGPKEPKAPKANSRDDEAKQREAEVLKEAEEKAKRERVIEIKLAEAAVAEASKAANRTEKELAAARTRRDDAVAAAEEAESMLAGVEERARRAVGELRSAERTLSDLRGDD